MQGYLPWNGFVADDPDVFAKKAVQLYQDKSCWLQAQKKNGLSNNGI
jgi:hypothetical protein